MVKRGHEVDLEYSKKEIIDRMNNFFGSSVVEKIKFTTFTHEKQNVSNDTYKNDDKIKKSNVTINKFKKKINSVNNDKIKKSLIELTKVFKQK